MDEEAQKMMQRVVKTHDNLATHVLALTAIVGAMLEKVKPPTAERVKFWSNATSLGQQGITAEQVEKIAQRILSGPPKEATKAAGKKS